MSTYVLIHGAFRGGWYWGPVVERLQQFGHVVLAPTLTGMGERRPAPGEPRPLVDRSTWVADVVRSVTSCDEPVVLVGHSLGGVIAAQAAGEVPGWVAVLGFLDAPVLRPGQSPSDLYPPPPPGSPSPDLLAWSDPLPVNRNEIADSDTATWMEANLTAMPVAPGFGPLVIANAAALALRRRIAFCSQTGPMYPASLSRSELDQRNVPYDLIEAGHDAPVSAPELVVGWLRSLVAPMVGTLAVPDQ